MKFLIVDDHALIRQAMRGVLRSLRPEAKVHEAGDAETALQTLQAHPDIDLVLLDLNLPDKNGLQVLTVVARQHPAVAVVMLSGDKNAATIQQALALGAQGYIPKTETCDVLSSALALVLAGGVYVPPAALRGAPAPTILTAPLILDPPTAQATNGTLSAELETTGPNVKSMGLTERQWEVLALLMEGKNNKLICRALDLAEPTVKNHVSAILKALGVSSRTEAVLAISRLGWKLPQAGQTLN